MPDIKITDLVDGSRFKGGDLILAERDGQPISLPGSVFASTNDTNPPSAAQFPNFAWSNNSSALFLADLPRGMSITDTTAETGIKTATRLIPDAQRGNFIFTAKINYSPVYESRGGIGITVTTGGTDTKALLLIRYGTNQSGTYGAPALYYSDHGNDTSLTDMVGPPISQARWFRIQVVGNVATAYISDEGVNWVIFGTQDFGEPITEYGFATLRQRPPTIGTALCDYFDSTELPYNRF